MEKRNLFCAAAILSLALSVPVYAGDVQTPTIVPPPPPAASSNDASSSTDTGAYALGDLITELAVGVFSLY